MLLSPPPAWSDEDLDRAIALAADDRRAEARAVLDGVLGRDPDLPRARLLDGILHARAGLVNEAIEIFDRLRRDHPNMSEPWNNLAVLYAAQGRFDEARETLLAALGRKPSAVAYANLGDIYSTLARQAYVRASELDPDGRLAADPGAKPGETFSLPGGDGSAPAAAQTSEQGAPEAPAVAATSEPATPETTAADPGGLLPAVVAAGPGDLTERPPGEEPGDAVAATPAETAGTPAPEPVCLRTGGFEDRRVLATVEEWLRSHGADAIEVRREGTGGGHELSGLPAAVRESRRGRREGARDPGERGCATLRSSAADRWRTGSRSGCSGSRRTCVAGWPRSRSSGTRSGRRTTAVSARRYILTARATRAPDAFRAAWVAAFPEQSIELEACG